MNNKDPFLRFLSIIHGLAIVAIVLLLGFAGYLYYQAYARNKENADANAEYHADRERGLEFHWNREEGEKRLWGISDVYLHREGQNLTPRVQLEIYTQDPDWTPEDTVWGPTNRWEHLYVTPDQLSYAAPESALSEISSLGNKAKVRILHEKRGEPDDR